MTDQTKDIDGDFEVDLDDEDEIEWYQPDDPTPRHACPCCDYVTLPERYSYLICPVCFWEDEGPEFEEAPLEPSGANHGFTLAESRHNFKTIGACHPEMVPHVLPLEDHAQYAYQAREH
ncbi:CPCC family cysteine-rich protein [Shimia marina]|uniref:Cysteine-rich CPCC domain-containing protein n=1 Tax=Shimia marina TaxID=321267 RepID=A0A0P1EQ56_9RHOB|nr:CPCC family cysteine-rich protein [Shimia marina]CUH52515.1 hypothetical protein SHM7688_01962 [Shimia marina]SFE48742.1 Cysteine-rich CPCC [Shimia marina]